jgi:adenylate cyclase
LPVSFRVGDTQVQIFDAAAKHELDFGLNRLSLNRSNRAEPSTRISPGPETLAAWLEALSELQRAVAGSQALFQLAAKAIFNPGGLDGAMVLLPAAEGWQVAASHIPYPDHGIGFRADLVEQATKSVEAIYHDATVTDQEEFIRDLHSSVVCPVMNEDRQVVAIVYGFRSLHRRNSRRGIRPLEAQFVQVVADALSAGMIRMESEAQAARSKVLLEQAFSPNVARQLQSNPRFLEAQTRDVSVLFADVRGFTSISERIGTRDTYTLLSDLMDRFSDIIDDLEGVIIDFYGDGVSAFWNAPLDQPEHALLACQAGMEMLACVPELNQIWSSKIGEDLRIGIGVNTGPARVGNSGSRRRLKYGPRGSTVNLASRLEDATKQIGIPMVVSTSTANQVKSAFVTQRIIKSDLAGYSAPTDIYRLIPQHHGAADEFLQSYQAALEHFESGNLDLACGLLNDLSQRQPADPSVQFLLQVVEQKIQNPHGSASGLLTPRTNPMNGIDSTGV